MGRALTGSVRWRHGAWHLRFALPDGREISRRIDAPDDGGPYDEDYAKLTLATLLRAYKLGTWKPDAARADEAPDPHQTVYAYAAAWAAKQTYDGAPDEAKLLERYLAKSDLGRTKLSEVRARHCVAFIRWLEGRDSERGGKLGTRTVRNAYDPMRRALDEAVLDELLVGNPAAVAAKKLPKKADKKPGARELWPLSTAEVSALVYDERLRFDRRVRYALLLLTGMRFGELGALRWSDWDRTAAPLTKITLARAIKKTSRREGTTKTGAVKRVPVHPALEEILAAWHREGWARAMGREPAPGDLVLPSVRGRKKGDPQNPVAANRAFKADQTRVGIEPTRHQHAARHTLITRAQADGGDGAVIRWITHAPPRTAFDGYTRIEWSRLCEELAKLRVPKPGQ